MEHTRGFTLCREVDAPMFRYIYIRADAEQRLPHALHLIVIYVREEE